MTDIGQAQANADLVLRLLTEVRLSSGSCVLFAGAGPGQMFDYAATDVLRRLDITFTDINEEFLSRVADRARHAGLTKFQTVLDDVESPHVPGPFDVTVLVLVLEHVNWKLALKALADLPSRRFLIVTQRNPVGLDTNVSPNRPLRGSLQEANQGEEPHLIDDEELRTEMGGLGYKLRNYEERSVLDAKTMCGYVFSRE